MPATGQADNTITFSFDSPKSVDLNAIQNAINADPAVQQAAAQEATPAAEAVETAETTPPADAQTTEGTAQTAPPAEELKVHKITVDGQELEVTEADLKSGHMRHRDYTQKTQALSAEKAAIAQERQAWQQEKAAIANELAQIDQFLRDQTALDEYYVKAFGVERGQQIQAPVIDPNKPITAAEAAAISRYNAEQVRIHNERQLAEVRAESLRARAEVVGQRKAAERATAESEIDRHVGSILAKYPALKKFEGIEDDLFGEAARYMPSDRIGTLDEAKQRLSEAADRRMATMRAIVEEEKKQEAVRAAKLKQSSTEATGGAPPKQAPGKKISLATGDRNALLAAAEADLRAMLGR